MSFLVLEIFKIFRQKNNGWKTSGNKKMKNKDFELISKKYLLWPEITPKSLQ